MKLLPVIIEQDGRQLTFQAVLDELPSDSDGNPIVHSEVFAGITDALEAAIAKIRPAFEQRALDAVAAHPDSPKGQRRYYDLEAAQELGEDAALAEVTKAGLATDEFAPADREAAKQARAAAQAETAEVAVAAVEKPR